MKKIRIELTMDELICMMFAFRKAIHYTHWFDPTYFKMVALPDKEKHLKDYETILMKLQMLDGYMTNLDTEQDQFYNIWNAEIFDDTKETCPHRLLTEKEIDDIIYKWDNKHKGIKSKRDNKKKDDSTDDNVRKGQ